MRPGLDERPGRCSGGLAPGTDPVCLLITTVAVVVGLVAAGLANWPAAPVAVPGGGRPGPLPIRLVSPANGPSSRAAVALLAGAATASGEVAYHGVEMLAWWGPRATTAAVAEVWHRPGQEPAVRAVAPGLEWPAAAGEPGGPAQAGRTLAAVPSLTPQLVRLLSANYVLAMGGSGSVAGRTAEVVTVRRAGGALAARFWLDRVTKLPLRRETYSAGGGLLSEETFLSLSLGEQAAEPGPAVRPWHEELGTSKLAALRAQGWPLPGRLPGNLALLDARQTRGAAGPVVHLAYSDGLSAVSVFIQRGQLPPGLAGWSRAVVAGHAVYADDDPDYGSVAWDAHGFVFTVIAQGPARTLSQVVAALPHDHAARPGLLTRMWIGTRRLLSWLGMTR